MNSESVSADPAIDVRALTMAYGDRVIQRDLNFTVSQGDVFIIMGGSGCGKSTLLRHLIGLHEPAAGAVFYQGVDFWHLPESERQKLMRRFGILYQNGALWSSMTVRENVALPLEHYTDLSAGEIDDLVSYKLALVGLAGFGHFYPGELSGGMRKRAGLARAMALDPDILYFDEPSAGLDPISSRQLDDLIIALRNSLGTTIIVVTHELPSIFAIGTNSIFLDADSRTIVAAGDPRRLRDECENQLVRRFLRRGESPTARDEDKEQGGVS